MRAIRRIFPSHLIIAALPVLVLSVYWQTGTHAFINLDDNIYVFENPPVLRGLTPEGVWWSLTTFHASNWHPLTWLSHMADVSLFGVDAGWHHRVNVLFHVVNTVLLFLVLSRMTGATWPSAVVAALFGVHPLHVESVAWVTERKDVLSTLFLILTIEAYLRYVRRPSAGRYCLVVAGFALGLMCKPMLVTLPFVLLLLDFWPLGRVPGSGADRGGRTPSRAQWPALVREKAPLFALSAASCAVTFLAQREGDAVKSALYPLGLRLANAALSYVKYLGKLVWPSSLSVFYPHQATFPWWQVCGSFSLLLAVTALVVWQRRRRPYMAVGWFSFAGMLIPVIGIVQVGSQAMADRYTYVPLIGIFIALAWGVPEILAGWRFRRLASGALAGAVITAFSVGAWNQVAHWRDSVTLFSRALAVTDGNWLVLNNLGSSWSRLGRYEQATGYFREVVRINPDFPDGWNNLGASLYNSGEYRQAIGHYRQALRIKPDFVEALANLGIAYNKLGQQRLAIECYREALRIKPDFAVAWYKLGVVYHGLGQRQLAIACYREALRIDPDLVDARKNLGVAGGDLGQRR